MDAPRLLYQIKAAAKKDEAEILIYDEIGQDWFGEGVAARSFVKDLADIEAKTIRVRINSAGGSVFEGLAIYNALARHDAKIITEVDGVAASIASVIALAGSDVRMADNAFFMIHNPHGMAIGGAADMREFADLLDKVGGSLAGVYAEKSGQDEATVQEWMNAETWFTAEEAKAAGFVHVITKGKEIHARADLAAFRNTPAALRGAAPQQHAEPTAGGGPAPEPITPPNQQAVEAMEDTMSEQDAAAQAAALESAITEARAEERRRIGDIRALAREHNVPQDQTDKWLDNPSITTTEVKDAILAQIRDNNAGAPSIRVGAPRADADPARGFQDHVDFYLSVIDAAGIRARADVSDERLRPLALMDKEDRQANGELAFLMPRAFNPRTIRAAAGSDEQGAYSDTYGGYAVPTTTLPGLLQVGFEGDPTVGRTQPVPMASPTVEITARTDKDHSSSVSGGFTVTRKPETVAASSSRMALEKVTLKASSLFGLAYASEEILTDSAVSFAALIDAGFRDQFMAHIFNEKLRGLGGSEYTGIIGHASAVGITKETNQAADTIVYKNVLKMRARCWGYGNAFWLANHDCLPEIASMSLAVGTGGAPVYIPGTFGGQPDTLLGRPIFFSEYPSTVGDAGDIILWNPTQYLEGMYQPLRSAESVHVRFVNHERTFKLWVRNCGAPWWRSALTPAQGSNSLSPIVTLNAR